MQPGEWWLETAASCLARPHCPEAPSQSVFPVANAHGRYAGLVGTPDLLLLAAEPAVPGDIVRARRGQNAR